MAIIRGYARYAAATLLAVALAICGACADELARPMHPPEVVHDGARPAHGAEWLRSCLNQKERRAAVESGTVMRLAAALHAIKGRMPGTLIRARLCRRHDALVYVLTVLAHDGKVTRVVVDGAKGTLIGER
jgi:outer membrane lipoprotein SlyB